MNNFDKYVKEGIVRIQSPNKNRADSLIKEAKDKKDYLDLSLNIIPKEKWNSNFIVDYCYDIMMELIRAKMFFEGFNAGNSHEAEVSYLAVLGFSEAGCQIYGRMRYYRNGTKYYGTILPSTYAKKVLDFMNKNYSKLKSLIK